MAKQKKDSRYNVLSIRVTNEEKALFDELKLQTHKNISMLMREAMHHYFPYAAITTGQSQ